MPAVIMPKMGDAMEEGTLLKWLKNEGDAVAVGDPLAEIETDKATVEITAEEAGTLSQRIAGEGDSIPIGKPIAMILAEGESAPPAAPEGAARAPEQPRQQEAQAPARGEGGETTHGAAAAEQRRPASSPAAPAGQPDGRAAAEGRVKASPLARRIAQEHEIDLAEIRGSGPGGRIVREDVEAALRQAREGVGRPAAAPPAAAPPATPTAAPGGKTLPLSRMRAAIGRQMVTSKTTIPHYYVSAEVDMTEALAWRKRLNEAVAADGYKVSVNDMVVKACGLALAKFPMFNASIADDRIQLHDDVNISIAVALDEGLLGPVVRNVDKKSLGAVAREAAELVGRAREGKLKPDEFAGGTFTVSNLGPFGVDTFIAIVTPPQGAVLAVGSSVQKAVVVDGAVAIRDRMTVTISADHRITDGADGAKFVNEVRRLLENPLALLM